MRDNTPLSTHITTGAYYVLLPVPVDDEAKHMFRFFGCFVFSGNCGLSDCAQAARNMLQEIDLVTRLLMGVTNMTYRMIHWNGGKTHSIVLERGGVGSPAGRCWAFAPTNEVISTTS